jgi:hypothetical protein
MGAFAPMSQNATSVDLCLFFLIVNKLISIFFEIYSTAYFFLSFINWFVHICCTDIW